MVQEQLTDYISSQMKLGVARDAIKSALVSAGWVSTDVEDTLKKVEGSAPAQTPTTVSTGTAKPMTMGTGTSSAKPAMGGMAAGANMATGAKSPEPQMIRVSDLVSGTAVSPSSPAASPAAKSTAPSSAKDISMFGGKIKGNSFEATPVSGSGSGKKGSLIWGTVAGILILALAGLAWYFYSSANGLNAKIASLTSQSGTLTTQLASLQSQVNASSTSDAAEIASLTAANADLALNLSFYAVPLGTPSSTAATALPITISGTLSGGGKAPYALTTPRGAKIFIGSATTADVSTQMKPLVGQTIQVSGTYIQGSDEMTATSVASTTSQ